MANRRSIPMARLLTTVVCFACFLPLPASGQQAVGAGLLGGPPPCIAGSNPALFDLTGDGPSADDLPAFLEEGPTPGALVAHYPNENCFTPESREISAWEGTSGNPWPGSLNNANNVAGGFLEFNAADPNGDVIGGSYSQGGGFYSLVMLPSPDTPGAYEGVQGTGSGLSLEGEIQGWDLAPADGTPDYIGIPWAGLTAFNNCAGEPQIDDTMMLWVPVVPYDPTGGGPSGAVTVRFDLNCDGTPDTGYPLPPPIVPVTTTPVDLQSFTIASMLPSSSRGYALAVLSCVLPIGALGLARRWLTGIDV